MTKTGGYSTEGEFWERMTIKTLPDKRPRPSPKAATQPYHPKRGTTQEPIR